MARSPEVDYGSQEAALGLVLLIVAGLNNNDLWISAFGLLLLADGYFSHLITKTAIKTVKEIGRRISLL